MASMLDRVHRLTVDEYVRLAAGDPRWDGTELVEGVAYDMTPESALHAEAAHALRHALEGVFPDHRVRDVGSVRLDSDSLWEPDVYVAPKQEPLPQYPLASEIRLVVEVSVSSLRRDLDVKARGYATSKVPEYWLLVPDAGGYLLRHTQPNGDRYDSIERVPLPRGYEQLEVADLFAARGQAPDRGPRPSAGP